MPRKNYLIIAALVGLLVWLAYSHWRDTHRLLDEFQGRHDAATLTALETKPVHGYVIQTSQEPLDHKLHVCSEIAFGATMTTETAGLQIEDFEQQWRRVTYPDGRILTFMCNMPSIVESVTTADHARLFDTQSLQSEYAFISRILDARPSDIHALQSFSNTSRDVLSLELKLTLMPHSARHGHHCLVDAIPCIQMGDPAADPLVFVHLFEADVRHQVLFKGFSQRQIDDLLGMTRRRPSDYTSP